MSDLKNWQERADGYQKVLAEFDEWLVSGDNPWPKLPDAVKSLIVRGINEYRNSIERFEEWAEEEKIEKH